MPIFALNGGYCNCLFNSICSPTSSRSEEIRATCHAKVCSQIKPPTMKISHLMTNVFQKCRFFFIFPIDVLTMYRLVSSRLYWYDSDSPDGRYISDQDMRKQFSGKKITCFSRVRNFWCVPVKPKPSSGALRDGFRAREKYA